VRQGETFGLVGESGCGKSTTARALVQLIRPTSGEVFFHGRALQRMKGADLRKARRGLAMVFQDPFASLDPRMTVGDSIAEPLEIAGWKRGPALTARVGELMELVRLDPAGAERYPHEFSGGQCQRVGVARALAADPEILICDEAVSALDVSIQAQVLNLLTDLQDRLSLTVLFIAHDLTVVRHMANRVGVMYLGKMVEMGDAMDVFADPLHPYSRALVSAVPLPDPIRERKRKRVILRGDVPSPANPPSGCRFRTRCPIAQEICAREEPPLRMISPGRVAACHFAEDAAARMAAAAE
jgi:oligopeptide transport system ATP-binding protein